MVAIVQEFSLICSMKLESILSRKAYAALLLGGLCLLIAPSAVAQEYVTWSSITGATVSGNVLTKTAATGWGNAGAGSTNSLIASTNGYIRYVVPNLTADEFAVGLSTTNPDNQFYTIGYAFHRTTSATTYVRVNGTSMLSFNVAVNDVLTIERSGTDILFKNNGTTLYTATGVSTAAMLVDAALYNVGGQIANLQVSFPPAAPTGLSALGVSTSVVNLAWTDASTTETGFEIERSTTSGSGFALVTTTAANVVSYSDAGLTAGTTYYYRVRAKNAGAFSTYTTQASATTPATPGLVARWSLNGNTNDGVGTANGTITGSPTYSTDAKEGSSSMTFSGTTQYVSMGNPTLPSGTAPRTIMAWAKTTATTGTRYIFAYGNTTTDQGMNIGMSNLQLTGGANGTNQTYDNFWAAGVWHHIALTYDGTTAKLYADGVLVSSAARSWSLVLQGAFIARHTSPGNYWSGSVDDARVYSTALTASEILALATVPPAPTGLSATAASSTTINLSWTDASSNETGFQIERSTTSGSGYTLVTTTAANATSFSNTGLTAATTYYYRIRAVNADANSLYTAEVSATTSSSVPAAPTSPTATAQSSSSIQITWTDASNNETGFEVERSLTSGSGFALVTTTAANATSFTNTGLTASTTYYYRIRAVNASGQSAYTSQVTATTLVAPPAAPTGLTASATSTSSITLNWTDASSNETGFDVERSTTSGSGFSVVTTTAANATSYVDPSLSSGITYYYRVRAKNAGGNSAYTTEASATTLLTPPIAPSNLLAVAGTSSIAVTWSDNSSNEANFVLERSETSGSGFSVLSTLGANVVTYTDASAVAGVIYFYRIKATNSGGASAYSVEGSGIINLPGVTTVCTGLFCNVNGAVSVGTQIVPAGYKLAVRGKIMAEGLKILLHSSWPDYVFSDTYQLTDLPTLKAFIDVNNHLPGLPKASDVERDGVDLEAINVELLKKLEEMSLYIIQMDERMQVLEKENTELKGKKWFRRNSVKTR